MNSKGPKNRAEGEGARSDEREREEALTSKASIDLIRRIELETRVEMEAIVAKFEMAARRLSDEFEMRNEMVLREMHTASERIRKLSAGRTGQLVGTYAEAVSEVERTTFMRDDIAPFQVEIEQAHAVAHDKYRRALDELWATSGAGAVIGLLVPAMIIGLLHVGTSETVGLLLSLVGAIVGATAGMMVASRSMRAKLTRETSIIA